MTAPHVVNNGPNDHTKPQRRLAQNDTSGIHKPYDFETMSDSLRQDSQRYGRQIAANDSVGAVETQKRYNKNASEYYRQGLVAESTSVANKLKQAREDIKNARKDGNNANTKAVARGQATEIDDINEGRKSKDVVGQDLEQQRMVKAKKRYIDKGLDKA